MGWGQEPETRPARAESGLVPGKARSYTLETLGPLQAPCCSWNIEGSGSSLLIWGWASGALWLGSDVHLCRLHGNAYPLLKDCPLIDTAFLCINRPLPLVSLKNHGPSHSPFPEVTVTDSTHHPITPSICLPMYPSISQSILSTHRRTSSGPQGSLILGDLKRQSLPSLSQSQLVSSINPYKPALIVSSSRKACLFLQGLDSGISVSGRVSKQKTEQGYGDPHFKVWSLS